MTAELTESQINGRFQLYERPDAAPGKCAVCGAVDRPVIDFGFDLDYYGAVFFCVECMTAAGQVIGLVDGSKLSTAQLVQRDHETQLKKMQEVVSDYVSSASNLYNDFMSRTTNVLSPPAALYVAEPTEVKPELQELDGQESIEFAGDAGQDDLPISDERPVSVPSGTSNEPGLFDFGTS